jgi:hypothetical protein
MIPFLLMNVMDLDSTLGENFATLQLINRIKDIPFDIPLNVREKGVYVLNIYAQSQRVTLYYLYYIIQSLPGSGLVLKAMEDCSKKMVEYSVSKGWDNYNRSITKLDSRQTMDLPDSVLDQVFDEKWFVSIQQQIDSFRYTIGQNILRMHTFNIAYKFMEEKLIVQVFLSTPIHRGDNEIPGYYSERKGHALLGLISSNKTAKVRDILSFLHKLPLAEDVITDFKKLIRCTEIPEIKPKQEATAAEVKIEESSSNIECVVCLERQKRVMLNPCKHLCCCKECSKKVDTCPLCRKKVEEKIDVYL